ncbi:MAG: GAF domain-containing protein [Myxococcaceae bacterium]
MTKFEVHIPAANEQGFNVTFRVDAANWMAALKTGMQKLGEQGASVQNVLVDIQDDTSVHVTESQTGRVFRIKELTDAEAAAAQLKKPTAETPAVGGHLNPAVAMAMVTEVTPNPAGGGGVGLSMTSGLNPMHQGTETGKVASMEPLGRGPRSARMNDPTAIIELEKPTAPVVGAIGRLKQPKKDQKSDLEDTLSDVFERVQEVYAKDGVQSALYFLLDLAMEKVPSDAGSVFQADAGSGDLTFLAVRGPKATELLQAKLIVPAGTGIVGFCAIEGVSVALSDVQKDPRYYAAVSEKINFDTRSAVCSPMISHGRTFGCMQLLNRKNGAQFTEHELGLLHYIAHQAALYLNARS